MLILHNTSKDDKNPGHWHFPGDLPDSEVTSCCGFASTGLSFTITYQSRRNHYRHTGLDPVSRIIKNPKTSLDSG